ncbi:MAG: hypothetical protein KJ579_01875 [Verrucomicrobia bacterium]|nr:hypothetical protein [Verrucomicrobiota bacterium]
MKVGLMLAGLGLLVIGTGGSAAADKPAAEGGTNSVHASLVIYPNAVIATNDAATGMTFSVEPNGRELKAIGKDGTVLWKVDLVKKWRMGSAVIRHLSIRGEKIEVTVGKHAFGEVEIRTGRDQFKGSD